MKVYLAEDFNGNLTSQSHQLETEDEKIVRLRNLGYKSVSIQDEDDDSYYEVIPLNSVPDDATLWLVAFKETIQETNHGRKRLKRLKREFCIYANTVEDASASVTMFKYFKKSKISDIIITAIAEPKDNVLTLVAKI